MSRALVFVFVAITMFLAFFYVSDFFDQPEPVAVVENEVFVEVAFVNQAVNKAEPVNANAIDIREFPESEAKQHSYVPYSSIKIDSGALWAKDVKEGMQLTPDLVSNPGEKDYMYLSLKKDQVPYYYLSQGSSIVEALPIQPGDRVSFVATTSSQSNLLESGYSDIDSLTSNVIIDGALVLQAMNVAEDDDSSNEEYGLIIALTVKQVLKLEMAQKIGAITLVPAKMVHKYLSVKSSDLIEHRFGVRQLRGN
ncbi:TPA: pilus assembly protein CpaB [Vibrio harveyi]|jgi:pilus assembly protein CpaB|uniref:Pilus assembly protein CpaB n=1 Tax=Vibrio harveyi TaxID=669 RepID=A0ABN4KXH5_VIBHA|nr:MULTISPECIES: pilus assembly protein CpaB [Vibrio]AMF96430.1 pilus assembly protein CpaB [Vibrio harveyi]AWB00448.1 pilus assembly protein CpaB [Vibrio harveyi]EKO3826009.1 pilus assembly protein CpaB [Vibrio harveyi]EKO3855063.1 pilus assembly protein CpaB [Vibrio harveyi]ELE7134178.1 pilus assembly protein CpaB [Vibrio harveyi]